MFKKTVKVPLILQMEETEGGAACLTMILAYHHKWVNMDQVRVACGISRDGIDARSIVRAGKALLIHPARGRMKLPVDRFSDSIIHTSDPSAIVINLFVVRRVGTIRREISSTQYRSQANLDSATVSGIDMIETIKATGSESGYFERWSGFHACVIKAEVATVLYPGDFRPCGAFCRLLADHRRTPYRRYLTGLSAIPAGSDESGK